jgi:hypothetical protein
MARKIPKNPLFAKDCVALVFLLFLFLFSACGGYNVGERQAQPDSHLYSLPSVMQLVFWFAEAQQ